MGKARRISKRNPSGENRKLQKMRNPRLSPAQFPEKNPHGRGLPPAVRTLPKSPGAKSPRRLWMATGKSGAETSRQKPRPAAPPPLRPFPIFAAPGMRLPPQRPAGAGGRRAARPHTEKPGQRGLRKKSRPLQESPGLRITKQGVRCASPARAPGEAPGLHTAGAGGPQAVSAAPRQSARFKKNARQNANYA